MDPVAVTPAELDSSDAQLDGTESADCESSLAKLEVVK